MYEDSEKPSKRKRFHLITLILVTQIMAVLLYLNVTPGKPPSENLTRVHSYGWPCEFYDSGVDRQSYRNASIFKDIAFAMCLIVATAYFSEKIIEWRE